MKGPQQRVRQRALTLCAGVSLLLVGLGVAGVIGSVDPSDAGAAGATPHVDATSSVDRLPRRSPRLRRRHIGRLLHLGDPRQRLRRCSTGRLRGAARSHRARVRLRNRERHRFMHWPPITAPSCGPTTLGHPSHRAICLVATSARTVGITGTPVLDVAHGGDLRGRRRAERERRRPTCSSG